MKLDKIGKRISMLAWYGFSLIGVGSMVDGQNDLGIICSIIASLAFGLTFFTELEE